MKNKRILVTYGHLVMHSGAARVISEIVSRSELRRYIELICIRNNVLLKGDFAVDEIQSKHKNDALDPSENIFFSNEIKRKILTRNYLVNTFGVYNIMPDIYSAQFCIKECFNVLQKYYKSQLR